MIKTFIFVEDGSVDIDELQSAVGDDTLVLAYRKGCGCPQIQQPEYPVSQYKDRALDETREVLNEVLSSCKMSKTLRQKLEELFNKYYS